MADTVGDIIGRNYRAGRAIGDDFSESRFNRGAAKIRAQFEERAAAEQKTLEDYLPDIENELRALAQKTGALKRNVVGRDGRALDIGAAENLYSDISRASDRRAGAALLSGDVGGALGMRAGTQAKIGNFDNAAAQAQARDRVVATTGAMDAQGNYVPSRGAQGIANVQARYGQGDEAAQQTQQADTFRLMEASKYADQLYRMAANPKMFDPDTFAGTFEAFKQVVPEMGDIRLQLAPDAEEPIIIYQGDKATGSLSVDEFANMAQQFTAAPGAAVGGYMKARTDAITAEKTRATEVDKTYRDARIDVAKKLVDEFDMPASVAKQLTDFSSSSGGWQLQDIGSEPGNFLVNKGGKSYRVQTNVPADPKLGIPAQAIKIYDLEGNPVAGDALDTTTLKQAAADLAMAQQTAGYTLKAESIKATLDVLNQLQSADSGAARTPGRTSALPTNDSGKVSRAERNNNPGNIEDRGQFRSNPAYMGSDGRFARFDNPEAGQQAFEQQLQRYMTGATTGQPLTTVRDILRTWSPQSDPTNQAGSTNNYIRYVAQQLGVSPDAPLSPDDIPALSAAMAQFESGNTGGRRAIAAQLPPRLDYQRGGEQGAPSQRPAAAVPLALAGMDPNVAPAPMSDFNAALRRR